MIKKRFENRLNKSNVKFNTLNPVWDTEKEDALNVFEMIDELNYLNDCCDNLIDDNTEYVAEINQMHKENEQLKQINQKIYELISDYVNTHHSISTMRLLKKIEKELKTIEILSKKGDVE